MLICRLTLLKPCVGKAFFTVWDLTRAVAEQNVFVRNALSGEELRKQERISSHLRECQDRRLQDGVTISLHLFRINRFGAEFHQFFSTVSVGTAEAEDHIQLRFDFHCSHEKTVLDKADQRMPGVPILQREILNDQPGHFRAHTLFEDLRPRLKNLPIPIDQRQGKLMQGVYAAANSEKIVHGGTSSRPFLSLYHIFNILNIFFVYRELNLCYS